MILPNPPYQQLAQQQQYQQAQQEEDGFAPPPDNESAPDELGGDTAGLAQEGPHDAAEPWLRDLSEEDAYNLLIQARNMPDKIEAYRQTLESQQSDFAKRLEALQGTPQTASFDIEKIKAVLEAYDPGLAKAGLAEALGEALKFTPVSQETLDPLLNPLRQQLGDMPIGNQIVLSHYDPEEVRAIVPPTDQAGNVVPETQRHKDFLSWFQLQPHAVQMSMNNFGPGYVRALKKFEQWEGQQKANRTAAVGETSSRLAGGRQPSANRSRGQTIEKSAEELFLEGFNEV